MLSHSTSCFAGYSFANEPRKTNVCFAATCFSLRLIISYASLLRQKSGKPLVSRTHKRVHMEHIRPPHASMRVRLCSMLTFAFANIIAYFFRDAAIIFRKLLRYARLIIHFFFRKIISEITSRRISSEVSSAYTPTMPHCNR